MNRKSRVLFNEELQNKLKNVALFSLFLCCAPIILVATLLLLFYRSLIELFLQHKYGNDFLGLLKGADAIWPTEQNVQLQRNIVNAAVFVQGVDPQQVKDKLKATIVEKCLGPCPKLASVRKQQFGYTFLLNNPIDLNQHIKLIPVDEEVNEDFLQRFLSEIANKPLPQSDTALWEFLIFDKPINWNGEPNVFVAIRFHHCVSDGFSLMKFIVERVLEDSSELTKVTQEFLKNNKLFLSDRIVNILRVFVNFVVLLLGPSIVLYNLCKYPKKERDPLMGRKLSGEKIVAWAWEKDRQLVNYVKKIKNEVSDTRFSEIVLTAISASLTTYYEQKFITAPEYVTKVIPAIDITQLAVRPADLFNDFLACVGNLPISIKNGNDSWLERLRRVKIETANMKKSYYIIINYLLIKLLSSIYPIWIQSQIVDRSFKGLIISILPGMNSKVHYSDGVVNDGFFWVPDPGSTGIGFALLTYDDRFHLGLIVDKAMISDHVQVRTIVNDVFKQIVTFYENK